MEFFNKKEDVIEIKLTQYGKHLLSKGRFKPYFYAFYDDNILYDQRFSGRSDIESQNRIEPRIQENTPSFRTQYVYSGIETEIVKFPLSDSIFCFKVDKLCSKFLPLYS